jgi:concanavalin A-like lectin/glucanase superfamily protein/uncharacterized protein DUF2341
MRTAILALLAGCGFNGSSSDHPKDAATDAAPDAAPDDGGLGMARKKTITIDKTKVMGKHDDFPVWIDLLDADVAARAAADGRDIYFTKTDGSALPYELQRWDRANHHLQAWVRGRVADDASSTVIVLHYGDATMAQPPQPAMVFSDSFVAVWHLDDTLATAAIADSLGAHNGTATSLSTTDSTAAALGNGILFDGGAAQIHFANPVTGSGSHTISVWVTQQTTADNDTLIVLGNGTCGASRWLHSRYNAATMAVGFYCNDWDNPAVNLIGAGPSLIHWVYDGNKSTIYRNGAKVAGPFTQTGTAPMTTGPDGYIGNVPDTAGFGANMGAHALIDEVRIASVVRPADYIQTEWQNQSAPQTFYTVGPEQ